MATSRVARGVHSFTLAALAEATAIDPTTVEQVMTRLEAGGPFTVERVQPEVGEIRWHVRGSAYDLDGWDSDVWNVST